VAGDSNGGAAAVPAALSATQLVDFIALLESLRISGIEWIAYSVLGPDAALRAAPKKAEGTASYASEVGKAIQAAERFPDAVALLRREAHRNSRLLFNLNRILAGERLGDDNALQAFTHKYEPFISSASFERIFPKLLRTVCAIALGEPQNQIVGSGFLVGPDLVMTNYHVLETFLRYDSNTQTITALPNTKLFCFFDYFCEPAPSVPPSNGRHASLVAATVPAPGWLVYARKSRADDGKYPYSTVDNNELDYAIIKLSQSIGQFAAQRGGGSVRGWLTLREDQVDTLNKIRVLVFQHPGKAPQQFDVGELQSADPSRTRLWYTVSTAKGSSGGAAVDLDGRVIALHNAEVQPQPGGPGDPQINQGIRIDRIIADLQAAGVLSPDWNTPPEVSDESMAFWSLNDDPRDPQPIIGRKRFRQTVEQMSARVGNRVLVVSGPPGSGRRFSIQLLRRTVGAQRAVAKFEWGDLQTLSPEQFVRALMDELGVLAPATQPMPTMNATENAPRFISQDLPQWVAERIAADERRDPAKYPAWVVINAIAPEGQREYWADNLKELIASLADVRDPGQPGVDVPQLRWLFLSNPAASLPVQGTRAHDEDLDRYDTYAADFAECLDIAWRSLPDKAESRQDSEMLEGVADSLVESNAGRNPLRLTLAKGVRTILNRPRKREDGS
jgi:V8-like Glu-specific endopeptidase